MDMADIPDNGGLRFDQFVSQVVRDPAQPANAFLLFGYLGKSSEADHVRLYFDPQLADWIDIPTSAILFAQAIDKSQSLLGGSLVWIERDALLTHANVGAGNLKAKFLEGRIQKDFLAGRTPALATPGTPQCPSPCGTTPGTPHCPSPGSTPGHPLCPSPCGTTPGTPHCPP